MRYQPFKRLKVCAFGYGREWWGQARGQAPGQSERVNAILRYVTNISVTVHRIPDVL